MKGGHPRYGVFDFAVNVFHHVPCGCSDVCDSHLDFILNVDSFNMTTFLKHMSTNPREFILAEKNMWAAPQRRQGLAFFQNPQGVSMSKSHQSHLTMQFRLRISTWPIMFKDMRHEIQLTSCTEPAPPIA